MRPRIRSPRRRARLLVLGATACLVLGLAGTAQAGTTVYNVTIPYDGFTIGDPCNGDDVVFQGDVHAVIRIDDQTQVPVAQHLNGQDLTAVDAVTGAVYRVVMTENTMENLSFSGASGFTGTVAYQLIGPGDLANFDVHDTTHFTTNANGQPTAYHNAGTLECRG